MILGLAPALASLGVEVTVITTDSNGDTGQQPLDVPLNQPIKQDDYDGYGGGYEVIYFRCSPFRRYKFSLDLLRWLNSHAHEYDLAHIHALFSPVSSFAARICRQKGLPYILRPLGTLDPADLRKKRQLKQLYTAVLERPNIAGAAALHFTSEQEAKISERFGVVTRDLVLPLGVIPASEILDKNLVRQQFGIPSDVPLVLFMSRVDPKKGLDLLIPALEKLLAEGLKFHFVLAGGNPQDTDYVEQIKTQIQNSPLHTNTTITGFVTGEFKSALLQTADLFVLPSYYENFGIAVAEAMVRGTAVVISDQVHIYPQIRDSNSGWVCPTDVQELFLVIRDALQNPEERKQRGLNAQQYTLQHYSWEAIGREIIKAYAKFIDNHHKS